MVIGLSGVAQSGKNTAAGFLADIADFAIVGFADALREMALAIDPVVGIVQIDTRGANFTVRRYSKELELVGYEGAKCNPEVRRFLQRLGTDAVRNGEQGVVNVAVADVRFPNEAAFVHQS